MVLQWSAVAHCSRYLVQRSDRDAQSGFVSVASVRDTVFEDTGLDSGEPYWYRLRGFYDSTYGSFHVSDTTESWSAAVCESTVVCWQKVYGSGQGGEVAASIAEVADGYVFTGLTPASTAGASSVWLVKVDCRGSVVWDKAFGGEGFDQGFAVRSDGGGVVLAGARGSDSVSLGGSWLAHMDGNGAPTWESRGSIVFDRSPGWFSLYTLRRGGALSDEGSMFWWHRQDSIFKAVVAGVDMAGQKQWQTVIDKRQVWCGAKLLDGRVVVGGHADSASGGCWAAQLSGDGMVEWQSQYRGLAGDALFGIAPVLDGYVATGLTRASDTSACDLRLMHISRTGYAWLDTTYRSNTGECGSAVVWNQAQQALIVAGLGSSVVGGSNDVLLLKADFSGRVAWRRWFGGGSSDAGLCVGCTRDGGFLVLGTSSSFGGTRVYVVKTDSRGNCPFQP
jgi:hypothetical protein